MMFNLMVAALFAQMAFVAPTEQSHQGENDGDEAPARVEQFTIHAIPEELRAYVLCRAVNEESSVTAGMEVTTIESLNDADCKGELEAARPHLLTSLRRQDATASPDMNDVLLRFYVSMIDDLPIPASVAFTNDIARISQPFTVPDGMWEYHLCRSLSPVYLNGEKAEPRFPNDPDCERSRAFSRDEALAHLERVGEPRTEREREELVEQYIRDIDLRDPSPGTEP